MTKPVKTHQCRVEPNRFSDGLFHVICKDCKDIGGSKRKSFAELLASTHTWAFNRKNKK